MHRLALAVLAAVAAGCGVACTTPAPPDGAPAYYPLKYDPYSMEPAWHRYAFAFGLTQRCNFVDNATKLRLALVALQGRALEPPKMFEDIIPDDDIHVLNQTPLGKLCNPAMAAFVKQQAAEAMQQSIRVPYAGQQPPASNLIMTKPNPTTP